ncbi:hypothetical protein P3X46_017130 [Hevea brasiliensis]|uniref:Uncharacterized protein n=1 Tax=Hevea brasiliensis TaxID=3981 RepID=A0ABQ9M337_HEVBR|nr:uncharacterized protein LOC110647706 [Hevea brasiliensis]KAJ9174058.1 hypothetical protein P3X46_017130 [Hevea brasiliensis]
MDQHQESNQNRKRPLDDPDCDSPESKLIRVASKCNSTDLGETHLDSDDSGLKSCNNGVTLVDSGVNSSDAKWIQDDLLNILDESDESTIQGLDSLIKSFEEEILVPVPGAVMAYVAAGGGECQPDLGYLLEASDDELGLPPTFSSEEKNGEVDLAAETSASSAAGFGEMLGLEEEIPSYDTFELGLAGASGGNSYNGSYNDSGDFVALGGLFDCSEENYAPATEVSGVQWQPESLSAL